MSKPSKSLAERLWSRVDKTDTCWLWTGPTSNGYGVIGAEGGRGAGTLKVHRVSWELANGPIPDGKQLDHLCRVRNCVNPDHLEVVTQAENLRRAGQAKTHCPRNHPLQPREPGKRRRACSVCSRARYQTKKEAA